MERLLCSRREGDLLIISGTEFRHLRALRLKKGERLEVFCEGRLFLAFLLDIGKDYAVCSVVEELKRTPPEPKITLYQCLPVDLKLMDEVIDRASQAGAFRLIPLICKRGSNEGFRVQEKMERWKRISLASFKQCKRPEPMDILPPIRLKELQPEEEGLFVLDNFGANLTIKDVELLHRSYGLVVGPEGGLSSEEVDFLRALGFVPLLLKPYVYRSEMAGAVAVALFMNLAGN